MLVLIEKMALLTILMGIGYLCAKLKIVGPEFNKGLSKIVINVLLAGMILSSVINKQMSMAKADVIFGIGMLTPDHQENEVLVVLVFRPEGLLDSGQFFLARRTPSGEKIHEDHFSLQRSGLQLTPVVGNNRK